MFGVKYIGLVPNSATETDYETTEEEVPESPADAVKRKVYTKKLEAVMESLADLNVKYNRKTKMRRIQVLKRCRRTSLVR